MVDPVEALFTKLAHVVPLRAVREQMSLPRSQFHGFLADRTWPPAGAHVDLVVHLQTLWRHLPAVSKVHFAFVSQVLNGVRKHPLARLAIGRFVDVNCFGRCF